MEPAAVTAVGATGQGARVERLRRGLAPFLAFLAACLGMSCLLNLAQLALEVRDLSVVSGRFAGWAGVGACAGLCLALVALLASARGGPAVPLALGATAAVFGLALGQSVTNDAQIAVAFVTLGVASGGLLGAAVCLPLLAPSSRRLLTVVAWALPILAGVPMLDELALGSSGPRSTLQIALHPPVWPLAVVSVLLVSWSALSLLVEGRDVPLGRSVSTVEGQLEVPAQRSGRSQGGEDAWTALIVAVVIPLVAVMLLGFEPDVSELWLRPLVIVVVAVAVLGLSVACFSMPSSAVRVGFAAVSIVLLCWPASIGVLLLATSRSTELSRVLVGVIVAAVGLGAGLGPQWPARGIVGGLLLLSVGAAGAWAVPESRLLLAVPVAAMAGGASAALLGGLRFGLESPLGVRLVGAGAFSALTLGVVLALPLSWALGGGLPVTTVAADADAKVLLGLTFAAAVLGAGYVATQSGRRPGAYN